MQFFANVWDFNTDSRNYIKASFPETSKINFFHPWAHCGAGPFLFQDISMIKQNPKKKMNFMHFWRFAPQKTAKSIFGPGGSSENPISSTKLKLVC